MARKSDMTTPRTEWGKELREVRMRTSTTRGKMQGTWPLSMPAFAAWLSEKVKTRIAPSTYTFWEMGHTEPDDKMKKKIRKAVLKHPLPQSVVSDDHA